MRLIEIILYRLQKIYHISGISIDIGNNIINLDYKGESYRLILEKIEK